jgi:hypothetical protein
MKCSVALYVPINTKSTELLRKETGFLYSWMLHTEVALSVPTKDE